MILSFSMHESLKILIKILRPQKTWNVGTKPVSSTHNELMMCLDVWKLKHYFFVFSFDEPHHPFLIGDRCLLSHPHNGIKCLYRPRSIIFSISHTCTAAKACVKENLDNWSEETEREVNSFEQRYRIITRYPHHTTLGRHERIFCDHLHNILQQQQFVPSNTNTSASADSLS